MIYELCVSMQDVLEDDAQSKGQDENAISLIEERAAREAEAFALAQKEMEAEARRRAEERVEEERILKQMVDEEMSRRREVKRKSRALSSQNESDRLSKFFVQSILLYRASVNVFISLSRLVFT
jgi:eukaryotic translation initiation factor 2-alpha kinase 4